MDSVGRELILRGKAVGQDQLGSICLNELWQLAGEDDNRRPNKWWRGQAARILADSLSDKIGRDSPNLIPDTATLYYSTGRGRGARTFAHPVLALAYAEFLNPELGVEVREIFLRFKAKDVTLAAQILEDLSEQSEYDELRVQLRQLVKAHNKMSAGVAKEVGVTNFGAYNGAGLKGLYGGMNKAEVLRHKGLEEDAHHLEHAGHEELAANYFKATQAMAKIKREGIKGQSGASHAHQEVGEAVRATIRGLGNSMPEDEPALEHIREAEKRLKALPPKAKLLPKRPPAG